MNTRLLTLKSILWAFVGMLVVVSAARFLRGLGATTNLSDVSPWGIWIGFDVMGGVALAAGGFVIAATVYIFGLEKYRPFARPAILTAFLGYIAVATGLLYDLGRPWNIWHPMIYPQHHSVLFEVAMCVMIYLTVLALEFAPVVLEHKWFNWHPLFRTIHHWLKTFTIPLVILGIILSTLHQSSLGSLFLIAPYRVHPLWYSSIIYVQFFISAIGLGLMMVTMESLLSAYFFHHRVRTELLAGLGRAASLVLALYVVLRLGDLAVQHKLIYAFDGSWQANLFWIELTLMAILPAVMLSFKNVRTSIAGLAVCSTMTVVGVVMNRIDLSIVTFARPGGQHYFPTWIELAVSVGIVSAAALAFIFLAENFKVYPEHTDEERDLKVFPRPKPQSAAWLGGVWNRAPRRYSLAAVAGAALAVGFLPRAAIFGAPGQDQPVGEPLTLSAIEQHSPQQQGRQFILVDARSAIQPGSKPAKVMLLGVQGHKPALFPHDLHVAKLGENACATCHHLNKPMDTNTRCGECHRDVQKPTDLFDHDYHIQKNGGNDGCVKCHVPGKEKSAETAVACSTCHQAMVAAGAFAGTPLAGKATELEREAPGYKTAMHTLCIGCHKAEQTAHPDQFSADFARCDGCHRVSDETLNSLEPAPKPALHSETKTAMAD